MKQTAKTVSPMSNEGRNAYVIEHLTNAMLKLLRDKPLGEISISELIEEAGVGRASFYRNFEDKADILKAYLNKIFHEWVDEYEKSPERPLSEQLRTLFAHFEKYRDFYTLLNDRGLLWLLKDVVVWIFGPKPEHSQERRIPGLTLPTSSMAGLRFGSSGGCRNPQKRLRRFSNHRGFNGF